MTAHRSLAGGATMHLVAPALDKDSPTPRHWCRVPLSQVTTKVSRMLALTLALARPPSPPVRACDPLCDGRSPASLRRYPSEQRATLQRLLREKRQRGEGTRRQARKIERLRPGSRKGGTVPHPRHGIGDYLHSANVRQRSSLVSEHLSTDDDELLPHVLLVDQSSRGAR